MLKKLKELWNPIPKEDENRMESNGKLNASSQFETSDAVNFKAELIDAIVKNTFFSRYRMADSAPDTFVLWVTAEGQNYQTETRKPDFLKSLQKAFDDANLPEAGSMAKWIVKNEAIPDGKDSIKLNDGVYLEICPEVDTQPGTFPQNIAAKARISIVDDSGSLIKNKYILDAKRQQIWQIGRGEKDKQGRKNHIALSDNENDPLYVKNRSVSNAHLQILFVADKGFCLKSLNNNSRTIVYRAENRVADLRDEYSLSNPLQHGDRIELEKTVSLLFEIITK